MYPKCQLLSDEMLAEMTKDVYNVAISYREFIRKWIPIIERVYAPTAMETLQKALYKEKENG